MIISFRPEKIPITIYENALNIYIERIKKINGVKSINMIGNITSPGLSDLDILIVVDDKFSPIDSSKLSVKNIDDRVFLHGPVIVPESLAQELEWIIYANNIYNLYGENILLPFKNLNEDEKKLLSYCYLIDFSESRLQQFSGISKKVEMRPWLTRVWSVIHSFYLIKEILKDSRLVIDLENDLKHIKKTRVEWENNGKISDETFLNSLHSAKKIHVSLFINVLQRLYGDNYLEKSFMYHDGKKRIQFSSAYKIPVYRQITFSFFGKKIYFYDVSQISNYAAHINMYFPELKLSWSRMFKAPAGLKEVMAKRYRSINKHNKWLLEHAPYAKSMNGYIGVNTKCGIGYRNKLVNIIGKIVLR